MPNLCSNRATIRHRDPVMLRRLLEAYRRCETCHEFLPMPASVTDVRDWRNYTWGTKWDFGEGDHGKLEQVPGGVILTFVTAWEPPLGLYLELFEQGFEVVAAYFESGEQVCGRVDGAVIRHFRLRSENIEEIRKHVDADIVKEWELEDFYSHDDDEEEDEEALFEGSDSRHACDEPWGIKCDLESFVSEQRDQYAAMVARFEHTTYLLHRGRLSGNAAQVANGPHRSPLA